MFVKKSAHNIYIHDMNSRSEYIYTKSKKVVKKMFSPLTPKEYNQCNLFPFNSIKYYYALNKRDLLYIWVADFLCLTYGIKWKRNLFESYLKSCSFSLTELLFFSLASSHREAKKDSSLWESAREKEKLTACIIHMNLYIWWEYSFHRQQI